MGQILSQPITKKESENGGDEFLKFGLSTMQGWRASMEDSHSMILDLNKVQSYTKFLAEVENDKADATDEDKEEGEEVGDEVKSTKDSSKEIKTSNGEISEEKSFDEQVAFFGVFDGHGGSNVALFSGEHLPKILKDEASLIKEKNYGLALQNAFLACDRALLDDPILKHDSSGCAATTILVTKNKLVCANAGDSRIVLSIDGSAKPMSYDHKPSNDGEKARIVAAGGFVEFGRVNGNLALSRCIGDFDFKKSVNLPPEEQVVTAFPDVIEHNLDVAHDEFIILACDGIWDCLTSQQCVDLVRKGISLKMSLTEIAEAIIDVCLAPNSYGSGIGCDNMSIAVVAITKGKSLEQWYEDIIAKGNFIEKSFDEIRGEIFNTAEDSGFDYQQQEEEQEQENARITSLSQLINRSAATFQDGTYYIDQSDSASLLASIGLLKQVDDENEASGEDESVGKVEEIEKVDEVKVEEKK